ncbi:hypothetical protein GCM10025857_22150 [Alicyclobacillus contaminans]|nr:hypothetical protein GCM10025857_22150 [Alicyclobacillus contaminans]
MAVLSPQVGQGVSGTAFASSRSTSDAAVQAIMPAPTIKIH